MLIFVTTNIFFQLNLVLYLSLAVAPVFVRTEAATGGVLWKKVCLKISQNSQENTFATFLKKRLWHRCFLVNFAKFLRTSFLQNKYFRTTAFARTPLKIRVKRQKQPLELFCKKEVFLKISQISQENTCVEVSF